MKIVVLILIVVLVAECVSIGVSTFVSSRDKEWGVKISVSDVSQAGLKLTADREDASMTDTLMLDWLYVVQKRTLFGWKDMDPVNIKISASSGGEPIEVGNSQSQEVTWDNIYGELKPGIYRIGKRIAKEEWYSLTEEERKQSDSEQILYATFVVFF